MSVTWRCDRCSKKFDDRAAMVSYPPKEWQAYQLVRVVNKNGEDFGGNVVSISHLCDHCQVATKSKEPEIKFA